MSKILDFLKDKIKNTKIDMPDAIAVRQTNTPDYDTRDNYLKSLRRDHRRIMDEKEKAKLQKIIKRDNDAKEREILFGSKRTFRNNKSNKNTHLGKMKL